MNVTKENFKECLPVLEEAIRDAAFVAFDFEFSGLHTTDGQTYGKWIPSREPAR